jgi:hypothetical protein
LRKGKRSREGKRQKIKNKFKAWLKTNVITIIDITVAE